MNIRIISGGQTGADRGALDSAINCGIEHGGYCPKGRISESGEIPERYKLIELPTTDYRLRTKENVRFSDVTIIFYRGSIGRGSRLTLKYCQELHKPVLMVNTQLGESECISAVKEFVSKHYPKTLNIAGSRESKCPGIADEVYNIMTAILG